MKEIKSTPIYTVFLVSSLFSAFMGLVLGLVISNSIKIILFITLISALSTGITFSFIIYIALKISAQKPKNFGINEKDILVFGRANHQLNLIYRGGQLILTQKELIFTPSNLNLHKDILRIPLDSIQALIEKNFYLIIPTGLYIELKNGDVERFVINERQSWLQEINQIINI
jgi:hypothetical protein